VDHVFHLYARPLYAAIGDEDNRNRRPAEWDAVLRKLMTVDFVLAHPATRFWATEAEKVALLRERLIPEAVWPRRQYTSRRPGGLPTIRYFVDKSAFTKTFESRDRTLMTRFLEYCELRRQVEETERYRPLTPEQHRRFRERCADFLTPAFDAPYRKHLDTSTLSSTEVYAAAFPPCLLRVHALGHRYDPGRPARSPDVDATG
jgi:hypothetical protein